MKRTEEKQTAIIREQCKRKEGKEGREGREGRKEGRKRKITAESERNANRGMGEKRRQAAKETDKEKGREAAGGNGISASRRGKRVKHVRG